MILRARERGHSAFCATTWDRFVLCDRTASIALAIGSRGEKASSQPAANRLARI
jgi:hypothetical protein